MYYYNFSNLFCLKGNILWKFKAKSHQDKLVCNQDCAHLLHLQTELIGGETQRSHPSSSTRSL